MSGVPSLAQQSLEPIYQAEGLLRLAESPFAIAMLVLALMVLAALSAWCSLRERTTLKSYQWRTLVVLRTLAIFSVGLSLAGWQKRPVTETTEPSRVVLLIDSSTSMQLPTRIDTQTSRQEFATQAAVRLAETLREEHEVSIATFAANLTYDDQDSSTQHPGSAATRLGDAIRSALDDHPSATLAGLVVLSDGRSNEGIDPAVAARRAKERSVPIHTVGYGPLSEPPSLAIDRLEAPKKVYAKDPIRARATLSARGGFEGEVEVTLRLVDMESNPIVEQPEIGQQLIVRDRTTAVPIEIDSPPPGEYQIELSVVGRNLSEPLTALAPIESIDRKTTVLLIAGGPTREYRFLRDQLHRDSSFEVDVLLQTSLSGVSQDARTLLAAAPGDLTEWNEYDVVVSFDPDWQKLGVEGLSTMRDWVARRGGGLLLVQGAVRNSALQADVPEAISLLAPVTFSSDPLDAVSSQPSREPRKISVTPVGLSADYLRLGGQTAQRSLWTDFDGFYSTPQKATPKMGAAVHARFGPEGGAEHEDPLFVEHHYGAGRVAYLATGEVWRLRRIDAGLFTELYTKLLRRLSQGRLLGADALGSLVFDQPRYDTGSTISLRLSLIDDGIASDQTVEAQILDPAKNETKIELSPLGDALGNYVGEFNASLPGVYEATVSIGTPGEEPIRFTARAEASLPVLESLATTQDQEALRAIAEMTNGLTFSEDMTDEVAERLAAATPSRAETRVSIGPPDSEYGRKAARFSLLAVVCLLTTEWALRRLWRLA